MRTLLLGLVLHDKGRSGILAGRGKVNRGASVVIEGNLRKMAVTNSTPIQYTLPLGERACALNELIGQPVQLRFTGQIHCIHCGRQTRRSFQQGYCYPCSQRLAACDLCIVKPELCHFDQGTCREPEWGLANCMQPHIVYLANTSGLKVGITRASQIPTRWIDQGAQQALPILQVASRFQAGLVEVELARQVSDKTDWRRLLKGEPAAVDLFAARARLLAAASEVLAQLRTRFGADTVSLLPDADPVTLSYPVTAYPHKVASFNLDKQPEAAGELLGIKGQYLILSNGVINIRKYGGYRVELSV